MAQSPTPETTDESEDLQRLIGRILLRGRLRPLGLAMVWRMASKKEQKQIRRAGLAQEPVDIALVQDVLEELIIESTEMPEEARGRLGAGDLEILLEGLDADDDRYALLQAMQDKLIAVHHGSAASRCDNQ